MLPCSISSCHKRRAWSSRWCSAHAKRNKLHGHPQGRALSARELEPYRRQARYFLQDRIDTPQVEEALSFLNDLLSLGSEERGASDAERQIYRLTLRGLGAREALEIVLGVWLYSAADERSLPSDARLTYALATAFLKGRPIECAVTHLRDGSRKRRYFTPPGNARKEIGEIIRGRLGLFFANVNEALKAEARKRQERAVRLAQPFDTNIPTSN